MKKWNQTKRKKKVEKKSFIKLKIIYMMKMLSNESCDVLFCFLYTLLFICKIYVGQLWQSGYESCPVKGGLKV